MTVRPATSVTVAIAAYNAVPFIARAISSALAQSGVDLEVIVVDDASTDRTVEFVKAEFGSDPRVLVISLPENAGPAAARNAALAQANGTWLAVLDADDTFEPNHLASLVSLGEKEGADIVAGNFAYFDIHRAEIVGIGLERRPEIQHLDKHAFVSGARPYTREADFGLLKPLFRVEFLRSNGVTYPEDVRHGEDMEMVLGALLHGAKYVVDRDLCSYLYTTRSSGHSRTPVNYGAQVKRTLLLRDHPLVRPDVLLRRLLTDRADALRQHELDRNWTAKTRKRSDIARAAMGSRAGRRWLFSRVVKKIVG